MTDTFGKFTRTQLLGQGGMGEVWKAWDGELGRWVALKFLKGTGADDLARFQREAQIASRLNHPNIASIYEVGPSFIAMQFIEGTTLKKGRDVVRLISVAARAVHFAHEQKIVHRDLKPENLMVTPAGHLFVMDFGLAKSSDRSADRSASGVIVGTPSYMAPEQARGAAVDARADVYGLGATLYTLLTGRRPFVGEDALQILWRVEQEDVVAPRHLDATIDMDLETIVLKCLQKDPAQRYADAEALAADLDRFLDGRAIDAHPPSAAYRLKKFLGRRKAILAIAAAGLVVTSLLGGTLSSRWKAEAEARQAGDKALDLEKRKAEDLKDLGALWAEVLLARQGLYRASENPRKVLADIRRALARVADFIKAHPTYPQGHFVRAQGLLYLDDLSGAESALREALFLDPAFTPCHALLSQVLLKQYVVWLFEESDNIGKSEERRIVEGKPLLDRAKEEMRKSTSTVPHSTWGLVRTAENDVAEALFRAFWAFYVDEDSLKSAEILTAAHNQHPSEEYCFWLACLTRMSAETESWCTEAIRIMPHFARAYVHRGTNRRQARRHPEAIADFDRAIEIDDTCVLAYYGRAGMRRKVRDFDGALADYAECLRLQPGSPKVYNNRGNLYREMRNLPAALADLNRALELDADFPAAWSNRGTIRRDMKDLAGALVDHTKALALSPDYPAAWNNRGNVRCDMGDIDGAIEDLTQAIRFDPRYTRAFINRGALWRDKGQDDKALQDFNLALEFDPLSLDAYVNRGQLHLNHGRRAEALADFRKGLEVAPPDWPKRAEFEGWVREEFK